MEGGPVPHVYKAVLRSRDSCAILIRENHIQTLVAPDFIHLRNNQQCIPLDGTALSLWRQHCLPSHWQLLLKKPVVICRETLDGPRKKTGAG